MDDHGLRRLWVAQFAETHGEPRRLAAPPAGAVASFGTHDTPTFAGFWSGADLEPRAPDASGAEMARQLRREAIVGTLRDSGDLAASFARPIDVLGAIIARANGTTFADAVRQYVTGPLGMNEMAFTVADRARLAVPYADGAATVVFIDMKTQKSRRIPEAIRARLEQAQAQA